MTGPALLRAALREHRGTVGVAAGLLGAHQALEALVPVVVGAALDDAIVSGDLTRLLGWLALLCLVFVALSNAYRIGARIAVAAQERVAHDLRLRIVDRVLHPAGGTADRTAGELLSLSTADADAAAGLVRAICFGIGVTVALLAGAAVLLVTSLRLGLLVLVGLPVLVWLGGRLSVTVARRADVEQERAADASAVATDLVAGIRVLAGIGGTRAGVARYRAASRSSLRATLASARAEAQLDAAAVLVSGVALAAVALVGGRLAAARTISIGELVAAAGVTQFLVGPIARLAWTVGLVARARASGERIAAILATPHAIAPPAALVPAPQPADLHPAGLRLRELRTRGAGPLDGIDLDLAPGGLHGIVAAEAEAAALLSCLGRDRDPDAGEIVVGDIALHALDPADARRLVLVAPHDAALAGDTLGSIVGALAHDATAVTRALEAAAAQDIVAGLPAGLATPLAESGRSLSGGQRQRVALARVLAGDAPVLVLHDPTTALDPATEAAVARGLRTARAGRTTLVVTTSPALLAACDRVTVIRDGRVVAGGTHTDLHAIDVGYRAATTGAADPDPRPRAREVRG